MSILGQRIRDELPPGMALPDELDRLLAWCEQHGWCDELDGPLPTVTPYPVDADVTTARFTNQGSVDLALNLGLEDDDADDLFEDRLYQFCEIGGDGTHAAWWLNDAGEQQVVVISSSDSSGSLFATTTDFLRALAVGHFELGLGQMGLDDLDDEYVNDDLKQWLTSELGLSIPACGQELALSVEPDPFLQWVAEVEESASTDDEADPTT